MMSKKEDFSSTKRPFLGILPVLQYCAFGRQLYREISVDQIERKFGNKMLSVNLQRWTSSYC